MIKVFNCLVFLLALTAFGKSHSVFYNRQVREKIVTRASAEPWAADVKSAAVQNAAPWLALSDEELWQLMFSSKITRSWMVWSNGFCPLCKKPVTMYQWKINPAEAPWKVQCPHCLQLFPKNDFYSYYRSGLDEHALFDPAKANRGLLYNQEHAAAGDSLAGFAVDDGEGYVHGDNRWRFIGAYLIYGQWKNRILGGVRNLSVAYIMTGDPRYAHKAAILLDRIADVYGDFDFSKQGLSYEHRDPIIGQGFVSVWHDACEETREMALAYDMIYDALPGDTALVRFLAEKAQRFKLANNKASFAAIEQNIEQGILHTAITNRYRIESNFPRTDATLAIIETILGWPEQRQRVLSIINGLIEKGTQVDGLSGEKGLGGYSSGLARCLSQFLSLYDRLEPGFISSLFSRHKNLGKTFRFHMDTWFDQSYYPKIGDTGSFAQKELQFMGATFDKNPIASSFANYSFASSYSLFGKLYEITGDPAYVQILYQANGNSSEGLPYDLLCDDSQAFRSQTDRVIQQNGRDIKTASFNKESWCLAMLYSGEGKNQRAIWLDYDIGGNHCHADGLNIGLFAKGLDLLPGFGYPPVQFGGWTSEKALWYRKTAAHNTVIVDNQDQMPGIGERETEPLQVQLNPLKKLARGKTMIWLPGRQVQVIRAGGTELYLSISLQQYDRLLALIDVDEMNSYVLDIFRVTGGKEHTRILHGYFGMLASPDLHLLPARLPVSAQMGDYHSDAQPPSCWRAIWQIHDKYHYLADSMSVQLAYYDLNSQAEAGMAKTWIAYGFANDQTDSIPSLLLRRLSSKSVFAGILEPFCGSAKVKSAVRLELPQQEDVAVLVSLQNGDRDIIISRNTGGDIVKLGSFFLSTNAIFCLVRINADGLVKKIALNGGDRLDFGELHLRLRERASCLEMDLAASHATIAAGNISDIKTLLQKNRKITLR